MFADENGFLQYIIYAIAIVGWLVSNIFKQREKQKKARQQSQPLFPEDMFDSTEELAGETEFISPTEDELSYEETVAHAYSDLEDNQSLPENEDLKNVYRQEEINENEATDSKNEIHEESSTNFFESEEYHDNEEIGQEIMEDENESFDLEKAIIYTEILKPKYIDNYY